MKIKASEIGALFASPFVVLLIALPVALMVGLCQCVLVAGIYLARKAALIWRLNIACLRTLTTLLKTTTTNSDYSDNGDDMSNPLTPCSKLEAAIIGEKLETVHGYRIRSRLHPKFSVSIPSWFQFMCAECGATPEIPRLSDKANSDNFIQIVRLNLTAMWYDTSQEGYKDLDIPEKAGAHGNVAVYQGKCRKCGTGYCNWPDFCPFPIYDLGAIKQRYEITITS